MLSHFRNSKLSHTKTQTPIIKYCALFNVLFKPVRTIQEDQYKKTSTLQAEIIANKFAWSGYAQCNFLILERD